MGKTPGERDLHRLSQAKCRPPRSRPTLVERRALIERIEGGLWRRLTLVSAPAGFGKTTLVAAWARTTEARVAWLSLDSRDDRPGCLLAYLLLALRSVRPSLGPGAEALTDVGADVAFGPLLEDLLLAPLADEREPFCLVVDDLHELSSEASLAGLAELLERLPASMHVVVTTRRPPPWPLARWQAKDEVTFITADELRFSRAETQVFARDILKLDVRPEDVDALWAKSEGWAAATQLLAPTVGRPPRASGATDRVGSSLLEGVFSQLDAEQQRQLLGLSIVETLTAQTAEALTGREDGGKLLRAFERGNLLLQRLDSEEEAWRLHALFRDWLRARLPQHEAQRLHALAAQAFAKQNQADVALLHAGQAGDSALFASLVERFGFEAICRSNLAPVGQWLEAVAPEQRLTRPWLAVIEAWLRVLSNEPGRFADLPALLQRLPDEAPFAGHRVALRCLLELNRQDLPRALRQLEEALGRLGEADALPASVLHLNAGTLASTLGNDAAALAHLGRADTAARRAGNVYAAVAALAARGNTLAACGQLEALAALVQDALDYAAEARCEEYGLSGHLYVLEAVVRFERWELEAAFSAAAAAWLRARPLGDAYVLGYAARLRFRTARALGRLDEAERARGDLMRLAGSTRFPMVEVWLGAVMLQTRGELAPASVEAIQPRPERHDLNLAELACARRLGYPTQAKARLLLEASTAAGRLGDALDWQVALALAEAAESDAAAGARRLEEAVALARAQEHRRPFEETRSEWRDWSLSESARAWLGPTAPHRRGTPVASAPVAQAHGEGVERPTARELEVLGLVATGCTNQEVARRLFVSVGTVKTHLHRVNDKLGARNRVEAIRKARALGLLTSEG